MSLKSQLMEDMKQAMKERDMAKLGTIRFLISEIKNVEIDTGEQDDAGIQKIIIRQIKQMRDALADFEKGGREDIVTQEKAKIVVLEAYMPKQLSDEELEEVVDESIAQSEDKNMGKIIGEVVKRTQGLAEGGRVSAMVRQKLQD